MKIDDRLLDSLTEQAKSSERLRMNMDLRNSPADTSQRMLNAIEPGSEVPIHRHCTTSETVVVLRGRLIEEFYDDLECTCTDAIELSADGPIRPPYAVYFQGGLTWEHAKLGILMSLQKMVDAGLINL